MSTRLEILALLCMLSASPQSHLEAQTMTKTLQDTRIWLSSTELLAQNPSDWTDLDDATRDSLISDEEFYIHHSLEDPKVGWRVHRGDLIIDGSFHNGHGLIVLGNLTIRGHYDDEHLLGQGDAGYGLLFVKGDVRVEGIYSEGPIHITNSLDANDLIYTFENNWSFEVLGTIKARGLVIDDKAAHYGETEVGFLIDTMDQGPEHRDEDEEMGKAMRALRGELFELGALGDGEPSELYLDSGAVKKTLLAGEVLFRERPAAPDLIDTFRSIFDEDLPDKDFEPLLGKDVLLDRVLRYWREDLP